MWPFKKQRQIKAESYRAWLEAQRPPDWFFSMSEIEQHALADIGADYVVDCAKAFAAAWLDEVAGQSVEGVSDDQALGDLGARAASEQGLTAMSLANALEKREHSTNGPASFAGKAKDDADE